MHGPGRRKTVVDFMRDVIATYEDRHGRTSDAKLAKLVGVSAPTFNRWLSGKHAITIENLDEFTEKLLGVHFFQCVYFPEEVSELKAIEVETLNRMDRARQEKWTASEVKKPDAKVGRR